MIRHCDKELRGCDKYRVKYLIVLNIMIVFK